MEKKKEQAILKLSLIKEWANDVIMRSKKMDKILESINNSNPYIKDITTFIDISDVRYQTPTGGSSGEYCTMGESLMQRRRVNEEVFRYVKFYQQGRRNDGT